MEDEGAGDIWPDTYQWESLAMLLEQFFGCFALECAVFLAGTKNLAHTVKDLVQRCHMSCNWVVCGLVKTMMTE